MDTTDPLISFDEQGRCVYCIEFAEVAASTRKEVPEKTSKLERILESTRQLNRGREADVVVGVSGGVDSSYLLVKAVEWGLRPLAVHVDAGWNSDKAVKNIHRLVNGLGLDLLTVVVHWPSMRQLQLSFLRSGLANLDVPQDHVFVTSVIGVALERRIGSVFSGTNLATESVLPREWGYNAFDSKHIRSVYREFGSRKRLRLPIWSPVRLRGRIALERPAVVSPLNLICYDRSKAVEFLSARFGWEDYGNKHYESRWTKYFQSFLLPYRFGYDKRKAHLSSRILSGELVREDALQALQKPLYDFAQKKDDEDFISKKLGISSSDLRGLQEIDLSHYMDFANSERALQVAESMLSPTVRRMKRIGALA